MRFHVSTCIEKHSAYMQTLTYSKLYIEALKAGALIAYRIEAFTAGALVAYGKFEICIVEY